MVNMWYAYGVARRWTEVEEGQYRDELQNLYVRQNKPLGKVAITLRISEATVFQRLRRLGIPTQRYLKSGYNNKRADTYVPSAYSPELAELFGVLLGDGHISHFQVMVTLGSKEVSYARHVKTLLDRVFGGAPRIAVLKKGYRVVYLGSVAATAWLMREGCVRNKVSAQVDAPRWIFKKETYITAFLRGFFDTDGSVYKLRYGTQISLTNKSLPLLCSLQRMLRKLGYTPSAVSAYRVYLTRYSEVRRFFREIQPANAKHKRRYQAMKSCAGT